MLLHFQMASLAIEVPGGAHLRRSGDHRLRRTKLNQLAVEIHPSPADNPVFVYREQIGVGDRPRSMHFKLKKIFPIDVFRSLETIQDWHTDLAVGIWF